MLLLWVVDGLDGVNPRLLTWKFGQNQVSNRWDAVVVRVCVVVIVVYCHSHVQPNLCYVRLSCVLVVVIPAIDKFVNSPVSFANYIVSLCSPEGWYPILSNQYRETFPPRDALCCGTQMPWFGLNIVTLYSWFVGFGSRL